MKKISVFLSFIMVFSMLLTACGTGEDDSSVPAESLPTEESAADTPAERNYEISNTSPAITAIEGEVLTLSDFSVVFDGDTEATVGTDISWKDENGADITLLTAAKGVTKLTAASGDKTKSIYAVAKAADESEYILYENDFTDATIDSLTAEGWTFPSASNVYSVADGNLEMDISKGGTVHAFLPEWLGDFGDYSVNINAKMLSVQESSRWLAVIYRSDNLEAKATYYHMCVRDNTTASNGVEFVERVNTNDAWSYFAKTAADLSTLTDAYHDFDIQAYGGNVEYDIDGEEIIYISEESFESSATVNNPKGYIGISMNGGKLSVNSVKITVQESIPKRKPLPLVNNTREDVALINPIANVEIDSDSTVDTESAGSLYLPVTDKIGEVIAACIENQVIPTFLVESTEEADTLLTAIKENEFEDANAVSADAFVLAHIRKENYSVRTGLILDLEKDSLTSEEANDIREKVRSAPATFCVIDSEYASKQLVSELQELAVAVWSVAEAQPDTEEFTVEVIKIVTAGVNGIISADAGAVAEVINTYLEENSMTRTPIMIGHRGNPSQAPENSISGFQSAYENGADVFEVDVEITKDGEIIIMHDSTITRTTNYTGNKSVNQMTLEEVKSYYILGTDGTTVTDEKVPTLKEVLEYFADKDIRIFVEFKGSNSANIPATAQLIKDMGMEHKVDVITFSSSFLTQTQQNLEGMSTGYLLAPGISDCNNTETALLSLYESITLAQKFNSTINPASGVVNSDGNYYTKAATDRGMTVWPWTYSGSWANNIGFMSGSDGVTTDDVEWAKDMIKLLQADDFSLAVGSGYAGGIVKAETYGGTVSALGLQDTIITVLSGNDCVSVTDGRLTAIKEGNAAVIFGYTAKTTYGSEYTVYTQPVTVTVNSGSKEELTNLIAVAENISASEYSAEAMADVAALVQSAATVLDNDSASESEISEVSVKLSAALNNYCINKTVSKGASYTTTEPNYEYWSEPERFKDDGVRLADGIKNSEDPTQGCYSAWNNTVNPVIVTLDLGEGVSSNAYSVYTAGGGFWGINNTESIVVYGSDDGESFTEIGASTTVEFNGNGALVDKKTQSTMNSLTVISDEVLNYRYIKFEIAVKGNFLWIDEVEARFVNGTPASEAQ